MEFIKSIHYNRTVINTIVFDTAKFRSTQATATEHQWDQAIIRKVRAQGPHTVTAQVETRIRTLRVTGSSLSIRLPWPK